MIKMAAKDKEKMMELRRQIKSRKPEFIRQDYGKIISLKRKWIKSRGLHSKLRLNRKGHRKNVSRGFGSPREVRGLSREGLTPVLVGNEKQLKGIDVSKEGIIISHIGLKNKISILKGAVARKIKVINIKDPSAYLKKAEEDLKKRKDAKATADEIKKRKKEDLKKKAEEKEKEAKKEKLEETLTDEEKKEQDKKEKDKVLTQKE